MNNIFNAMQIIQNECSKIDDFAQCKICPFYKVCRILQEAGVKKNNDASAFIPDFWDELS